MNKKIKKNMKKIKLLTVNNHGHIHYIRPENVKELNFHNNASGKRLCYIIYENIREENNLSVGYINEEDAKKFFDYKEKTPNDIMTPKCIEDIEDCY